jgi:hypothetical protein
VSPPPLTRGELAQGGAGDRQACLPGTHTVTPRPSRVGVLPVCRNVARVGRSAQGRTNQLGGVPTSWGSRGRPISMPPPTDASSPIQATDGRALRGSLARNVLADTTSGPRKGAPVQRDCPRRDEPKKCRSVRGDLLVAAGVLARRSLLPRHRARKQGCACQRGVPVGALLPLRLR